MSNLCIIPARGGSKRIQKKNIKDFLGKPIIAYSIEVALNSGLFDEVMVSTDDIEIAGIASSYGAKIPFMRSKKTSDDFATTFEVIEEVLADYKLNDKTFKYTCCIYPCAPFTTKNNLELSYQLLIKHNFDSVIPIIPYSTPIQRAIREEKASIKYFYPKYSLSRSQDLELSYYDAGQFYWLDTNNCMIKKSLITDNSGSVILSELESQDIDSKIDWKLAELKYELLQSTK